MLVNSPGASVWIQKAESEVGLLPLDSKSAIPGQDDQFEHHAFYFGDTMICFMNLCLFLDPQTLGPEPLSWGRDAS